MQFSGNYRSCWPWKNALEMSAPENPGVSVANRPTRYSTSSLVTIFFRYTWKISCLPFIVGRSMKMCRSNRPGRISALSRMSARFVAAMTFILSSLLNPSSWFSNSNIVRWTSLSPLTSLQAHRTKFQLSYRRYAFFPNKNVLLGQKISFSNLTHKTKAFSTFSIRYRSLSIACRGRGKSYK